MTSKNTIRLAILDDHEMVIQGLQTMLASSENIQIVNTFNRGHQLLNFLETTEIDVLLLDINLPDISGIEVCKIVAKKYRSIEILALSNHSETSFVKRMMKSGAKGYLLKTTGLKELEKAILEVHQGNTYLPTALKNKVFNDLLSNQPSTEVKLTRREHEVLQYVAKEYTSAEIAKKIFVSPKTIETHRMNLMNKLDVKNSVGLIRVAMENGLLDD